MGTAETLCVPEQQELSEITQQEHYGTAGTLGTLHDKQGTLSIRQQYMNVQPDKFCNHAEII